MPKIEKSLEEWVGLGFINPDQARRIRDYESVRPESSWILSGILTLGAIIVAIGVISLIAANWKRIPDGVKIGGDFTLLGVLALATLRGWEAKKPIQFEVLLLSYLLFCLASVGLIAQIYHTGGEFYEALLFWSLITFPAAFAARQVSVPFMWAGAFLTGVCFTVFDSMAMQSIFRKNHHAIFMAVPLLCAGFTIVIKSLAGETGATRAFRFWILISGLLALTAAEFHVLETFEALTFGDLTAYGPAYMLAAFAAFGVWQNAEYRGIQKALLLAILVIFLIPFHFPLVGIESSFWYAAATIVIISLMAVFLASLKERRLFQDLLLLLGVRFLVLYFQALGGLATTGVGLIVSGGFVIGSAVLWNKYRKVLAVLAERWMR